MYAVIQTGGKQYRVQPGDIVQIEKLDGDVGAAVNFDQVLLVSKPGEDSSTLWVGKPLLSGAAVSGEIVGQGRGEKTLIIKMKRRKQYRRTQGHRQFLTDVLVTSLNNGAGEKLAISAEDKKLMLTKFHSQLAPKGLPFTAPLSSTRKKRLAGLASGVPAQTVRGAGFSAKTTRAPAKTAAPKAAKKPAAKKST